MEVLSELPTLQYGVWLRGEVPRRGNGDLIKFGTEEGWYAKGGPMRDAIGGGVWKEKALYVPGQNLGQGKVTDSSLPRMGASDRGDETTEGG